MHLIAGCFFLLISLGVVFHVCIRNIMGIFIIGDFEVLSILIGVGIFMCFPFCEKEKGHVVGSFLLEKIPKNFQKPLFYLKKIIALFFVFILTVGAFYNSLECYTHHETSMLLKIPFCIPYFMIIFPLVSVFLIILRDEFLGNASIDSEGFHGD